MTTGQRIAAKRKEREFSQERLGELLGVSRQSIYKWESDASLPEIDKLVAMARLFQVNVGWLLGVEEDSPSGEQGEPFSAAQSRLVEEILRRYRQENPPSLTQEQVEQLVDKRLQQRPKSLWDKWSVHILFGLCAVFLAFFLSLNTKMEQSRQQYDNLSNSMDHITDSVDSQINSLTNSLTSRVEDMLKAQNSLLADYSTQISASDLQANTVTFSLRAVPKTYVQGTEITFLVESAGERIQTAQAQMESQDQVFTAQVTCPLTDSITISIVFLHDGVRETQILEQYQGLYTNSFSPASLRCVEVTYPGRQEGEPGALSIPKTFAILDYNSSSTPAVDAALGQSQWQSAAVGLFHNHKLVCWLEPTDQIPDSLESIPDAQGSYYLLPFTQLEVEEGDQIDFAALLTDEYGRSYVAQDSPGYVVKHGALEWPEEKIFSSDPADWEF
jgi:transcriptional regulator with XRE-family HTH domain